MEAQQSTSAVPSSSGITTVNESGAESKFVGRDESIRMQGEGKDIPDNTGIGMGGSNESGGKKESGLGHIKSLFSKIRRGINPELPKQTGPYPVGIYDYEWKPEGEFDFNSAFFLTPTTSNTASGTVSRTASNSSGIDKIKEHQLDIKKKRVIPSTLCFRLYYPADPKSTTSVEAQRVGQQENKNHEHKKKDEQQQPEWLPEPKRGYALGYGNFAKLPKWVTIAVFRVFLKGIKMPVFNRAQLIDYKEGGGKKNYEEVELVGTNNQEKQEKQETETKIETKREMEREGEGEGEGEGESILRKKKMPVIIFSHGLAGNRTTYSAICREMASYGAIVVAMEHRDGTASTTYLADQKQALGYDDFRDYAAERGIKEEEEFGPQRLVFQKAKLDQRIREIKETVKVILEFDEGKEENIRTNYFEEGEKEKEEIGNKREIDVGRQLAGRIDRNRIVMMGHSFGGTSTLEAIKQPWSIFKAAVTFDPWMFPVDKEKPYIDVPSIAIHSEHFHRWPEHNLDAHAYFNGNTAIPKPPLYSVTVKRAGHQHFSDVISILPWVARLRRGNKYDGDPAQIIHTSNHLVLEFLAEQGVIDHCFVDSSILPNHQFYKADIDSQSLHPDLFFN
ncbi:Platelet-activating factor acetylhydrolase [Zancudomyces culisetae]|uniref:1-alkyl-2-acetylglycerophosphocholine esterase n=1 Tax=Zancudomyces culisetae TaxID=1213189 RepID=A0A1R1PIX7_ZANCU|nr:Platelet-activating factor acetylhydrolase [Zancudomyces culisetae]OMH80898.1 Platelet-activating factor acetylhydrolase [Zancudomyces culisetae]|eukprot:OMH78871.1 Platelet-activating factor acetylhydrolase [Zancudomyces culisetae]